ncbi:ATP-binding protein, partial [Clostridium chrysemydis]
GRITSTDIVIILGNLIENAYDSFDLEIKKDKYVLVYINENSEKIEIQLKDNGKKIDPLIREYIFESGVSSKGEGRGIGLSTLKGRVELYDGDIDIIEEKDYKIFKVTLKK